MIILTLLDPQRQTVLKQWRFEQEITLQIGRAEDNQIVLNASCLPPELLALISRHHLTLQQINSQAWRLTSQGSNGTFINGSAVQQSMLADGAQFQLARGGPIFKIQLQAAEAPAVQTAPVQTPPQAVALESPADAQLASLKAELDTAAQERDFLQATLKEIQAQLPLASLSDRQADLARQLIELQQIQKRLHTEGEQLKKLPSTQSSGHLVFTAVDRDRLFQAVTDTLACIAKQYLELLQAKNQVQQATAAVEKLNAHLQANHAIASQFSMEKTRSESLAEQIQNSLQEFDRELARLQELQATENAKQFFSL